jgi:hypothetical protein
LQCKHADTGKLEPRCVVTNNISGSLPRQLLQVHDKRSKYLFLIYTGATVSIVPPTKSTVRSMQPQANLRAVNDTKIQVYSQISLTIDICLRREFR